MFFTICLDKDSKQVYTLYFVMSLRFFSSIIIPSPSFFLCHWLICLKYKSDQVVFCSKPSNNFPTQLEQIRNPHQAHGLAWSSPCPPLQCPLITCSIQSSLRPSLITPHLLPPGFCDCCSHCLKCFILPHPRHTGRTCWSWQTWLLVFQVTAQVATSSKMDAFPDHTF